MPDAVIVATARTPIGRAMKGSLVDCRPDDLTALVHPRGDGEGAAVAGRRRRRRDRRVRPARRRGRLQRRAGRRPPRRARRTRGDRQPLLLVVAADDPHGGARDPGGRGRRFVAAGVETVSRFGQGASDVGLAQRRVRDRRGAHRRNARPRSALRGSRSTACPTSTSRWARRRRTSQKQRR